MLPPSNSQTLYSWPPRREKRTGKGLPHGSYKAVLKINCFPLRNFWYKDDMARKHKLCLSPLLFMLSFHSFAQYVPTGMEDLDARIHDLRTQPFVVEIDENVTEVSYRLVKHEFEFGTAVSAFMLEGEDAWFPKKATRPSPEDKQRYQDILTSYYTAAVMENAMKWPMLCGPDCDPRRRQAAVAAAKWCQENGLVLRGHTLMWGVAKWLPDWMKELAQESPEHIERAIKTHFEHTLEDFSPFVSEWDLNNEMMHEDIFAEGMELESQAAYFEWATALSPETTFYVNEYGVLQGNEIDQYVEHIQGLLSDGANIGGIGDQAHFFTPIPSIEQLWGILDQLGQFDLPVKITEFDLGWKGMTPEEQADGLVRFYKTCFAHPAVDGIFMWGFWEGRHWRPNTAFWKKDWTPTPAAEAYMKLISEEWHTEGTATVENGILRFRGFPGTYEFTANGKTWTQTLETP
jgi:GH35 family endo-1,4-beta-xylanase